MDSDSLAAFARRMIIEDSMELMKNGGVSRNFLLEMQDSYERVIKNFSNLCATLNFANPLEINTLFQYMLTEGYLSYAHEFDFTKENLKMVVNREFLFVSAANILAGKGVCRNCAVMLKDILNTSGIRAAMVPVIKDENLDNISKKYGNHVIVFCNSAGTSYFLESTDAIAYMPINRRWTKFICSYDAEVIKKVKLKETLKYFNTDAEVAYLKEGYRAKNPCYNPLVAKCVTFLAMGICVANDPLLEDFYVENKEDYRRVREKLSKIKMYHKL